MIKLGTLDGVTLYHQLLSSRNSTEILLCEEVVIDGRNLTEILPVRKW